MHTRSRNKVEKEKAALKVRNVTFRSPIGFEAIRKDYVDSDTADKGYAKDDDSDENDGIESENERISKDVRYRERRSDQRYTYIPECNKPEEAQPLHGENKNTNWIYIVFLSFVLLVVVLIFRGHILDQHEEEPQPFDVNDLYLSKKDLKLEESLDNIRERFPSQDDAVWYTFSAGIKSITEEPNKPSVFLMLYEYNDKTPACLANEVSKLAISYIMGRNTMPVIVDGVQLKEDKALNEDAGELIVRYNKTVQNRGSLIVTNLHEVPANIAKSFHFFCDSYTPLVERAAYFFTLSTQGERLPKNKLQHVAERTMRNLWSDSLKDHRLEPLITRLSGYVIRVVPESKVGGCD